MKTYKTLWITLGFVVGVSFLVLGYFGVRIYQMAPPIPEKVVSESGELLFTGQDIKDGQNVWQSIGGQEIGSIWGHGAYQAPDWTADWLHREAVFMLDRLAQSRESKHYQELPEELQAQLEVVLQKDIRQNTYQETSGELIISNLRAEAFHQNSVYYKGLFTNDPQFDALRESYALQENALKDPERVRKMNAFFFWASWACVTQRPGEQVSYTQNWPPDKMIGNIPNGDLILWTGFSVIMLLLGVGLLAFYHARNEGAEELAESLPETDPLLGLKPTPSMKATLKYFWIVTALILVQVLLGVVTAHYGVEGQGFYGLSLAELLPYSVTRTWHVQLAIFWIATSWLATGLYIAPAVSGHEPKLQKLGVNFLFGALLLIVVGSLAGQWMGIMQKLNLVDNFWFGHQGYEYVDLGRFWQGFLLIGLFLWLFLMGRALLPALQQKTESRHLLLLFLISSIAIAVFYAAGLMWGRQTHLAVAEYWRWWVVHLWVEGFFEVFATVVAAFLFTRMGLLRIQSATAGVLFATIIFLAGGIIGTFHHLYFSGTPTAVLALGATFSALEVVPLVLIGFEAFHNYKLSKATSWVKAYKWPIYCLVAVSFWNLVGAGIFGFLINPPIALYYMQGLNTTPVHGHTALFGVYGMLGIGLMLFVLRGLYQKVVWKEKALFYAFWSINIGLVLMVVLSLLPIGLLQTIASVNEGMWYARSAEFMQEPHMEMLRWLRSVGDTLFAFGTVALAWFVLGLKTGWSTKRQQPTVEKTDNLQKV
ncbi:nitric-oxide reductase large subunit [Rapidithrix thailandica]|uniref:Nitric-oxide reductase large subunit n=1 Tax=Rapidithrix thailandica TaxID=413964 RepID=A0AAW9S6P3_9BACT